MVEEKDIKVIEKKPKTKGYGPFSSLGIVVLSFILAQFATSLFVIIYAMSRHWNSVQTNNWVNNSTYLEFFLSVAGELLILLGVYIALRHKKLKLRSLGLNKSPRPMDLVYILVGYGFYWVAFTALGFVAGHYIKSVNINQTQNVGFSTSTSGPILWLVFFSLVIVPPIVEELVFRGFLYSGLKRYFKPIAACLITSVVFAIPHLFESTGGGLLWIGGIGTFTLSIVLVSLREATGKLWASIGLHMLNNFVAFLSLFIFHVS